VISAARLAGALALLALLGGAAESQGPALAADSGAAGGSPAAPSARYWAAADLQTRPQIKSHVMPEYPRDLVAGIRGRVVLELFISREGAVDRIRVARSEPPGRFEQAAVTAFSAAQFSPGIRKGQRVPCLMRIEVSFGD
jgi:periplasmic protein TonB